MPDAAAEDVPDGWAADSEAGAAPGRSGSSAAARPGHIDTLGVPTLARRESRRSVRRVLCSTLSQTSNDVNCLGLQRRQRLPPLEALLMFNGFSEAAGIDRREFTRAALMSMLAGVSVTVWGCGSNPSSPSNGRTGDVVGNHGHQAVITNAQLTGNNAITLDIRGSADHPHSVELTVAELNQISAGQRLGKTSSTDPSASVGTHNHLVQFN
jgi:hypothetical protein